jgi:WD40 repeat protein
MRIAVSGALELRDGRLLSWSEDTTLRLWAADGTEIAVLRGHEGCSLGALELRDGRLLSWSADKTLRLWAADGTEIAVLRGHEGEVTGALELRDGRLLSWSEGWNSDEDAASVGGGRDAARRNSN